MIFGAVAVSAASLEWRLSSPGRFDYGRQLTIPAGFGSGEFTMDLWIRPDHSYPTGSTASGSGQLNNWSSADLAPYSSSGWWYEGNFLLDGHNNANSNFHNGTFTLQFYGRGRVRWLFGDGGPAGNLTGRVWSVGAYPASNAPSLLDGKWHHLSLVRRFSGTSGAQLELWIDGVLIDTETTSARTNMRQWWDNWSGFYTEQRGWYWGAEKQAAIGAFPQYEDYKGLVDEVRFWSRARSSSELATQYAAPITGGESGLVGRYAFGEGSGTSTCSSVASTQCITLVNTATNVWSTAEAPIGGDAADTTAPSVPGNLQGTPNGSSSVALIWSASSDDVGVASYRVLRDGVAVGNPAGTSFSDNGLTANRTYVYTVSAVDAANNRSGESAARQVTTVASPGDTSAPTTPANLQGTATSSTGIALTWSASSDDVGVVSYRVRRDGVTVGTITTNSFNDSGLAANTTYSYTVSALDAAGNRSGESVARQVTTPATAGDTTPPSVPTNLQGTSTRSTVTLSWSGSTDNVGVTSYRVRRNGVTVGSTAGTSFTDSGLAANTTYTYTVSARDAAFNRSAESATVAVTTRRRWSPD